MFLLTKNLALPTVADVHEGVIVSRIAAHAGDIVKGVKGAIEKDIAMAKCRKALDWEGQFNLALDPEKARRIGSRRRTRRLHHVRRIPRLQGHDAAETEACRWVNRILKILD